jgi:nucleoside-diphosphate-sugar epimerase
MAKRVYEHAFELNVRTVVNMSSMAVYGDVHVPIIDEETAPQKPSAYGRVKRESESIAASWSKTKPGLAAISLRLPGIVGLGSHHNFLSDVMQRLNHREAIVAVNPEAPFNNVVHVRELATFVGFLIHNCPLGHRAVNLAAETPLTIRSVLELMRKTSGRMIEITFDKAIKPSFLIDFYNSKALGFTPSTVEDSVTRFVSESTT